MPAPAAPRALAASLAALLALLGAGCGPAGGSPASSLDRFASALERGAYRDAYALLAEDHRRRVPFPEFEQQMRSSPEAARELAALLRAADDDAEVTAEVQLPDGERLELVLEDGRWRIRGNAVDVYDQSTPRAALRSFVRALAAKRYDVVLRFVPDADREGMTTESMERAFEGEGREETERLLAALRANLDAPIEVVGDRATMSYGEGASVQFLREDGVWKIEDPD
ncbi:MAG: hypothetical protein AAGH15_19370 [Myxococcota bacterium]